MRKMKSRQLLQERLFQFIITARGYIYSPHFSLTRNGKTQQSVHLHVLPLEATPRHTSGRQARPPQGARHDPRVASLGLLCAPCQTPHKTKCSDLLDALDSVYGDRGVRGRVPVIDAGAEGPCPARRGASEAHVAERVRRTSELVYWGIEGFCERRAVARASTLLQSKSFEAHDSLTHPPCSCVCARENTESVSGLSTSGRRFPLSRTPLPGSET